jgi:hypothetical protein
VSHSLDPRRSYVTKDGTAFALPVAAIASSLNMRAGAGTLDVWPAGPKGHVLAGSPRAFGTTGGSPRLVRGCVGLFTI